MSLPLITADAVESQTVTEPADWYFGVRCEHCGMPHLFAREYASAMIGRAPSMRACQCGRDTKVDPSHLRKWRIVAEDGTT